MNRDVQKSWEYLLNPEVLRPNLIIASIYIAGFELLKSTIVERIRSFYSTGFDKNGQRIDPKYQTEDRLQAKQSAPRSKLVGEIESGKFTVRGESASYGKVTPSVNVCVTLRVTNREKIETTLKRASLKMTVNGETYSGHKTMLWYPEDSPDLLKKITNTTPIRHGPATVGSLEFTVEGLKCPQHGLSADVSVTLIDEFDLPHVIRNRELWIAA